MNARLALHETWRKRLYWAAWVVMAGLGAALLLATLNARAVWSHEAMSWGWMGVGGLGMIVFWALVVAAVVGVAKGARQDSARDSRAREILEERYARGELTRDEFLRMSGDLDR
jgi:putative membrane protein